MSEGHVFVVDDDPAVRASVQAALTFEGYSVRCWHGAKAFLHKIPTAEPAVLLADMRMPEMSGLELHSIILAMGRNLPIIYISGESSERELIDSMKLHPVDFLLKPFGRAELLKAVSAGLSLARRTMRSTAERVHLEQAIEQLSPREQAVFQLLALGNNNAEIMDKLAISLPTAKQYKMQVMRKLGVSKLSQLLELSQALRGYHGQ